MINYHLFVFLNLIIAARKTVGDLKFLHLMKVGVTLLVLVIVQKILILVIVQRTLNLVSTTNKSLLLKTNCYLRNQIEKMMRGKLYRQYPSKLVNSLGL